MTREECVASAAAYALGALEPDEAAAYERHVSRCPICLEEVAAMQRTVDALPLSAPQYRLPSGLRRRTMRAVRTRSRRTGPARVAIAAAAVAAALIVAIVFTRGRPARHWVPPLPPPRCESAAVTPS